MIRSKGEGADEGWTRIQCHQYTDSVGRIRAYGGIVIDLDAAAAPPPPRGHRRPWWAAPLLLAAVAPATVQASAPMVPVTDLPPGTMRLAGAGDAFYVLRGNGTL